MTLSKSKIKYIHSLKDKKYRNEYNTFVAEGDKMVAELLQILSCQLLVATSTFLKQFDKSIFFRVEEICEVAPEVISKVSFQKNPQQVLAVFFQPKNSLEERLWNNKLCLALDGVQDPGNLGTIVRLADWYGIEDIFCTKDTADIYNPKVVQATMGAIARVRVHYVNLTDFLDKLKDVPVYGTFLDGSNMYETEITGAGIIVMGNEGNGIRPEVEKRISNRLFIPNYPLHRETSESLNVAIATAIICSEFRRPK